MGLFHRKVKSDLELLHKALQAKNDKAIAKLIANGLTPQFALEEAFGLSPINYHIVAYLLSQGSTPNVHVKLGSHNFSKATPLHVAAAIDDLQLIELLLNHGAEVNASCEDGSTPLMLAIKNGSVDAVKILLKAGASTDIPYRDNDGEAVTPLQAAVTSQNQQIIDEVKKYKEESRPDVTAICWRIIVLHRISTLASSTLRYLSEMSKLGSSEINIQQIVDERVSDIYYRLTNKERQFTESLIRLDADTETLRFHIHDIEAAATLLWVLSLTHKIPDYDSLTILPSNIRFPSDPNPKDFMQRAILRDVETIKKELLRAKLWVWRSNVMFGAMENIPCPAEFLSYNEMLQDGLKTAQNIGLIPSSSGEEDLTVLGMPYHELDYDDWQMLDTIASKRFKALNWALGHNPDNCWDVALPEQPVELNLSKLINSMTAY